MKTTELNSEMPLRAVSKAYEETYPDQDEGGHGEEMHWSAKLDQSLIRVTQEQKLRPHKSPSIAPATTEDSDSSADWGKIKGRPRALAGGSSSSSGKSLQGSWTTKNSARRAPQTSSVLRRGSQMSSQSILRGKARSTSSLASGSAVRNGGSRMDLMGSPGAGSHSDDGENG